MGLDAFTQPEYKWVKRTRCEGAWVAAARATGFREKGLGAADNSEHTSSHTDERARKREGLIGKRHLLGKIIQSTQQSRTAPDVTQQRYWVCGGQGTV